MEKEFELLRSYELELVSETTRKNLDRLSELLAVNFEEVGKSGRKFNREDVIEGLINSEYQPIELSCFEFAELSDTAVLIKYISLNTMQKARRSSVWVKQNNQWQLLYHQGTLCAQSVNSTRIDIS